MDEARRLLEQVAQNLSNASSQGSRPVTSIGGEERVSKKGKQKATVVDVSENFDQLADSQKEGIFTEAVWIAEEIDPATKSYVVSSYAWCYTLLHCYKAHKLSPSVSEAFNIKSKVPDKTNDPDHGTYAKAIAWKCHQIANLGDTEMQEVLSSLYNLEKTIAPVMPDHENWELFEDAKNFLDATGIKFEKLGDKPSTRILPYLLASTHPKITSFDLKVGSDITDLVYGYLQFGFPMVKPKQASGGKRSNEDTEETFDYSNFSGDRSSIVWKVYVGAPGDDAYANHLKQMQKYIAAVTNLPRSKPKDPKAAEAADILLPFDNVTYESGEVQQYYPMKDVTLVQPQWMTRENGNDISFMDFHKILSGLAGESPSMVAICRKWVKETFGYDWFPALSAAMNGILYNDGHKIRGKKEYGNAEAYIFLRMLMLASHLTETIKG